MKTTELTGFQYESLRDIANSDLSAYMLCKANAVLDTPEQYALWTRNNFETEELVNLGLLDDVTKDFSNQVAENAKATGRLFRVFRITPAGKAIFTEGHSGAIN